MALLAPKTATPAPPPVMGALVVLNEVERLLLDPLSSNRGVQVHGVGLAVHNHVSAGDEPLLVPLLTGACLPLQTAEVAELGSAGAG